MVVLAAGPDALGRKHFQCSLCRAVWWFALRGSAALPTKATFSALSVEPYGGSSLLESKAAPLCCFQCSLCRAVWWFAEPEAQRAARRPFSALSVEPYGGSHDAIWSCINNWCFQCSLCRAVWWFEPLFPAAAGGADFQCSLCRAVWWFAAPTPSGRNSSPTFSALSVEPYGGSLLPVDRVPC